MYGVTKRSMWIVRCLIVVMLVLGSGGFVAAEELPAEDCPPSFPEELPAASGEEDTVPENSGILSENIVTEGEEPEYGFEMTPEDGHVGYGESVTFTPQLISGGPVTQWNWDFDSDGVIDSTDSNPVWTYDATGSYDVTIQADEYTPVIVEDAVIITSTVDIVIDADPYTDGIQNEISVYRRDEVDVDIWLLPNNGQSVDFAACYIDFDSWYVSCYGLDQVSETPFSSVTVCEYHNSDGTVDYCAGVSEGTELPESDVAVFRLTFEGESCTSTGGTEVTFNEDTNRITGVTVSYGGEEFDVTGTCAGITVYVTENPADALDDAYIVLSPESGPRGSEVVVNGYGFVAGSTIKIYFDDECVGQFVTGETFTESFIVPEDADLGRNIVWVEDITLGRELDYADELFTVTSSTIVNPAAFEIEPIRWTEVPTPGLKGCVLLDNIDMELAAFGPDGEVIFAYDNDGQRLYKSTDGGYCWESDDDWDLNGTADIVVMAVSSDYDDDSTIVAATIDTVYRSNDGGKDWGQIGTAQLQQELGDAQITSVAVGKHYRSGIAIIVGAADPDAGEFGGMLRYTTGSLEWEDIEVSAVEDNTADFGSELDVVAVAFSPNHTSDAIYLAVATNEVNTYVLNKHSTMDWNQTISVATISDLVPTNAVIAFPDDYSGAGESDNILFIGTRGDSGDGDDVYRIEGRAVGNASKKYDLDVNGDATDTNVVSISVDGDYDDAKVVVMFDDAETVYTTDITGSSPDWDNARYITGSEGVAVFYNPHLEGTVWALTGGTGGAFSLRHNSEDGTMYFDQVSLINIPDVSVLELADSAVIDSGPIFALLSDPFRYDSVFKSNDGGRNWIRVLYKDELTGLYVSPDYVEDTTLYVTTSGSTMWRTTNGGVKFSGVAAQEAVTVLYLIDGNNYYTGHAGGKFYEKGSWSSGEGISGTVKSIAIAGNGDIYVGNDRGSVYLSTDGGDEFVIVGYAGDLGDGDVYLALDSNYTDTPVTYAACAGEGNSLYRWEFGESAAWEEIGAEEFAVSGLVMSDAGVLYAADAAPGAGVKRTIDPSESPLFESLADNLDEAAQFRKLYVVSGTNDLYGIITGVDAGEDYGYSWRLVGCRDSMAAAPSLSAPEDNSLVDSSVTLEWEPLSDEVEVYHWEVSTDEGFNNIVAAGDSAGTYAMVTGLTQGMHYWWRVYVAAGTPLASKKSEVWAFISSLDAPVLQSPDYGETGVAQTPMFAWLAVDGADCYELELADNALFTDAISEILTGTVWTCPTLLEYDGVYCWRVRAARNAGGEVVAISDWAESIFSVTGRPIAIDTLDATNITKISAVLNGDLISMGEYSLLNVGFEWSEVGGSAELTPEELRSTGGFSYTLTGLTPGTEYQYRAVANSGTCYGEYHTFQTWQSDLVVITIDAPSSVPADFEFTIDVQIDSVTDFDAANYEVQFDSTVLELTDVTAGQIGETAIPVSGYNCYEDGKCSIVQNVEDIASVAGTGVLATLHFLSVGDWEDTTTLEFTNGCISSSSAEEVWVVWPEIVTIEITPVRGDATGDNLVNAMDITKVERVILKLDAATDGADVDKNGVVNAVDITKVERIIVGQE